MVDVRFANFIDAHIVGLHTSLNVATVVMLAATVACVALAAAFPVASVPLIIAGAICLAGTIGCIVATIVAKSLVNTTKTNSNNESVEPTNIIKTKNSNEDLNLVDATEVNNALAEHGVCFPSLRYVSADEKKARKALLKFLEGNSNICSTGTLFMSCFKNPVSSVFEFLTRISQNGGLSLSGCVALRGSDNNVNSFIELISELREDDREKILTNSHAFADLHIFQSSRFITHIDVALAGFSDDAVVRILLHRDNALSFAEVSNIIIRSGSVQPPCSCDKLTELVKALPPARRLEILQEVQKDLKNDAGHKFNEEGRVTLNSWCNEMLSYIKLNE